MSDRNTVSVFLLGKRYSMTCLPENAEQLRDSAEELNDMLLKLNGESVVDPQQVEILIVAAALNLISDLKDKAQDLRDYEDQLQALTQKFRTLGIAAGPKRSV